MSKSIDYTPATSSLDKVMYPVRERPVYLKTSSQRSLFLEYSFEEIPKYKALVNEDINKVISIVSNNYRLLTNQEALELGKEAFTQIFTAVKKESLIPFKVIAPSTLASCHIDLIHQDVQLSQTKWDLDTWMPFLRVSNSYNRSIAFTIELGFVRKICANGVIFSKKTMKIKMYHTGKYLKVKVEGLIQPLKQLEEEFVNYLISLQKYDQIDKKYVLPLICKILGLKFNLEAEDEKIRRMEQKKFENTKSIINTLQKFILKN